MPLSIVLKTCRFARFSCIRKINIRSNISSDAMSQFCPYLRMFQSFGIGTDILFYCSILFSSNILILCMHACFYQCVISFSELYFLPFLTINSTWSFSSSSLIVFLFPSFHFMSFLPFLSFFNKAS